MTKLPRCLAAAACFIAAGALAVPAHAADPPSLRLIAVDDNVKLPAFGHRVPLALGLRVASVGGAFQLDVRRPDYGEWTIDQVDAETDDVLRSLPADDPVRGLHDFFDVTFKDEHGHVAARKSARFCPNTDDPERIDDSGPVTSRYPRWCESRWFPFTRGSVWGIDEGWAARVLTYRNVRWVRLKPGDYQAVVRIAEPYRTAFDIPGADAKKTLNVEVSQRRRAGPEAPFPAERRSSPQPEAARRAEPPIVTTPDPATLPDLVAGPAWDMRVVEYEGPESLVFAATPWNQGPGLLDVEGFREPGEDTMDAYQYFFDGDGNVVGKAPVGELEFDERHGHHHWHFEQFARYRLLDASQELVLKSHKQSFCIAPTNGVDLTVPGADWDPEFLGRHGDFGSVCGEPDSLWIRETLPVGWGDTYVQYVAGQSFRLKGLPDGIYYVEVAVNPTGALYDADESNNVELRKVRIGTDHGHRTVKSFPWHGIEG
jgi:hypothetical protein